MRTLLLCGALTLASPLLADDEHTGTIRAGFGFDARHGIVVEFALIEETRDVDVEVRVPVMLFVAPEVEAISIPVRYVPDGFRLPSEPADEPPRTAPPAPKVGQGDILPTPYHATDDIQFFPPGPEMRLGVRTTDDGAKVLVLEPANEEDAAHGAIAIDFDEPVEPEPWWQQFFMSEKARSIERNLGITADEEE